MGMLSTLSIPEMLLKSAGWLADNEELTFVFAFVFELLLFMRPF